MPPKLGPIKRAQFVRKLRTLGFEGPFRGGKHQFMTYGQYSLPIPSQDEYSVPIHARMLHEVEHVIGREVSREEWLRL